ncbi:MAG: dihydrofolate reductase [Actinomycetota bacterium]|nr:dihydrofolate reductase [Actinomycetota bacterium]
MTVTLVAAVGSNGVIGREGGLPWARTGDLAHFKSLTMGHVLVMGRRTYESIGRPLPGRVSIVITRQAAWSGPDGVVGCHDVESALARAAQLDPEVFVIGGEQVFAATLPVADRMVLTHVEQAPDGDTWFPAVDWSRWREVSRQSYEGFEIATYAQPGLSD